MKTWEGISLFLGQKKTSRVQQLHTRHPRVISWLQFVIYCSYTLNLLRYCTSDPAVDPRRAQKPTGLLWILRWRQYFDWSIYTQCSQWSDFHISGCLTRVCHIPLHSWRAPLILIKISLQSLSYNFSKIKCHRVLQLTVNKVQKRTFTVFYEFWL